jgi:rubrerythrin
MALQVDFSMLDGQDVLDVAIQVEEEARGNYEQLASWLEADGKPDVADFFARMAGLEQLHRDQLAAQRAEHYGDAAPRHTDVAIWEVEEIDYDSLGKDVDLKQAFELAMGAERRAGEYYAEALEYASDPKTVELFEMLRDSEEEHLRLLREQRDRLFGDD